MLFLLSHCSCHGQKPNLDNVHIVPGVVVAVVLTYALIVSLLPPPHRPPSPTTTTTADNGKTTPPTTGNITASADDSHANEHPGGSVVQVLFQICCQNFASFLNFPDLTQPWSRSGQNMLPLKSCLQHKKDLQCCRSGQICFPDPCCPTTRTGERVFGQRMLKKVKVIYSAPES